MKKVNYKYNIGETVQFRNDFPDSASTELSKHTGETVKIVEQRYYGGPCYKLEGLEEAGWFTESCFMNLPTATSKQRIDSNAYVVFAGSSKEELQPVFSAPTKRSAVAKAKKLATEYNCVEATYMPEDDDDINEIVYSNYVEGK
jgi:hypothetical protein